MPKLRATPNAPMATIVELGLINRVVTLVLAQKTYKEISEELGIPESRVRKITRTKEYEDAMKEAIKEMAADPRRKTTLHWIVDLLPVANRTLSEALTDPNAPWSIRKWAVEMVYRITGVNNDMEMSEEETLKNFLKQASNVTVNILEGDVVQLKGVDRDYVDALYSVLPERRAKEELPALPATHDSQSIDEELIAETPGEPHPSL